MFKMKNFLSLILAFLLLLSTTGNVFANGFSQLVDSIEFDNYGIKVNRSTSIEDIKLMSTIDNWETFDSKSNVPLNKVWTVKFSSLVTLSKIDAIVIERGNEFIPVNIKISAVDEIQVSPTYGFSGNTNYQMKIFLANGKKYKMDFSTVPEPRNADIEPNDTYMNSNEIYLNEKIIGSFSDKDYNDYYKIEIPKDGRLELTAIQLGGGDLDLYLYGPSGNDKYHINSTYDKTTATISSGLKKGTYYIRVYYSGSYGKYTLENKFIENPYADDNGTSSYITSNELKLNNTITGHIGYISDYNYGNFNDYFKIVIPQDGQLVVNAKQLSGGELDMYLYGATGPDKSYIKYVYDKIAPNISVGLAAGTYYLRLNDSGYYGPYELTTIFYPNTISNDSAASSYILADEISLNETIYGHIGYTYDSIGINQNDYYKIEIPSTGTLEINATQLDGGELDLYLYGSKGTDASYITYTYAKTKCTIIRELSPGTYYIRINYSGYYGGYELTTIFK